MNYGFILSKLDGTEEQFKEIKGLDIPDEFSYIKLLPKVLDLGNDPICVPCSISGYINCSLNLNSGKSEDNLVDLKKMFELLGSEDGMTFKEALKYLKDTGIYTNKGIFKADNYAMIGSIPVLKHALIMNGPCIAGLPVCNSLRDDFWVGPYSLGGHAIVIVGYDKEGLIIRNSWGNYYGHNGYYHLKYEDFKKFYEIWTIIKN